MNSFINQANCNVILWYKFKDLESKDANEILVRSSPKEMGALRGKMGGFNPMTGEKKQNPDTMVTKYCQFPPEVEYILISHFLSFFLFLSSSFFISSSFFTLSHSLFLFIISPFFISFIHLFFNFFTVSYSILTVNPFFSFFLLFFHFFHFKLFYSFIYSFLPSFIPSVFHSVISIFLFFMSFSFPFFYF